MALTILDWVILSSGVVLLIMWMFFFIKGNKHSHLFESLEEKEYPLKELYGFGYGVLDTFKYQYKSKGDRKLRQEVDILYGSRYADYYIRVIHAQRITIAAILFVASFPLYGLTGEIMIMLIMWMFSGLSYYYYSTLASKRIQERSDEMLGDFCEVVSQLALLTNAGMILKEAWEEVAYSRDSTIYKEMQLAVDDIRNGMPEIEAFYQFGIRCVIPEIKKFTSTITQGISKGSSELALMLQEQSKEVWGTRKQDVRRLGEKAASKLLIPISIMFIGILIMIIVPIFANLGV